MADTQGARPDGTIMDYPMIDPTTVRQPFAAPPLLRVRGRGACVFTVAGVHLLKETYAKAGLITRTAWGAMLAQGPTSGNPVLFLSGGPEPAEGADQLERRRAPGPHLPGRRLPGLEDHQWRARRGTNFHIPLAPTARPSTGESGVMLRADQIAWRMAVPRKPNGGT